MATCPSSCAHSANGGIRDAKVVDGVGERRRRRIVFGGRHAVAMLRRWGGSECGDVHRRLPECTEGSEVHGVRGMRDPRFIFFGEEAGAMEDADFDIDDVGVGDGILGEIRKGGPTK